MVLFSVPENLNSKKKKSLVHHKNWKPSESPSDNLCAWIVLLILFEVVHLCQWHKDYFKQHEYTFQKVCGSVVYINST